MSFTVKHRTRIDIDSPEVLVDYVSQAMKTADRYGQKQPTAGGKLEVFGRQVLLDAKANGVTQSAVSVRKQDRQAELKLNSLAKASAPQTVRMDEELLDKLGIAARLADRLSQPNDHDTGWQGRVRREMPISQFKTFMNDYETVRGNAKVDRSEIANSTLAKKVEGLAKDTQVAWEAFSTALTEAMEPWGGDEEIYLSGEERAAVKDTADAYKAAKAIFDTAMAEFKPKVSAMLLAINVQKYGNEPQ